MLLAVPADETLTIPLKGVSDLIDIEVKDDTNGLVLSFASTDLYYLPYDLLLISGGDAYDNFGVSYYFEPGMGDFTNAELTFQDDITLTLAYFQNSLCEKTVPGNFHCGGSRGLL